jgi:hypothetical protein
MESKLSKAQQEAKQYVEKHKLEKLVGEMLNTLVHSKDENPVIFMIKYLAGLSNSEELASNGISVSGSLPQTKPLIKFPTFPESCSSLLKKNLNLEVWDRLHDKKTRLKGDFYSCIKPGIEHPEDSVGLFACDEEAYSLYEPLFQPVIEELQAWSKHDRHRGALEPSAFSQESLDREGHIVQSIRVRIARNFPDMPFPVNMTADQRQLSESRAVDLLADFQGQYTTLRDNEMVNQLAQNGIVLSRERKALQSTLAFKDWPLGRGVWVSKDQSSHIKVNDRDHIRVVGHVKNGNIQDAWRNAILLTREIQSKTPLAHHDTYGYLTSEFEDLGTGLKATLVLKLQHLSSSPELHQIVRGYENVELKHLEGSLIQLNNKNTLGRSETQIISVLNECAKDLIQREKHSSPESEPRAEGLNEPLKEEYSEGRGEQVEEAEKGEDEGVPPDMEMEIEPGTEEQRSEDL